MEKSLLRVEVISTGANLQRGRAVLCWGMPAAPPLAQIPKTEQLEFTFSPQVTVDLVVDRLPDGRLILSHKKTVEVWGTTRDAAEQMGRSRQWVRDALEAGILRGERVGKCWRVDMLHLQRVREKARNF